MAPADGLMLAYLKSFLTESNLLPWAAACAIGSVAEYWFAAEPHQPIVTRIRNLCYGVLYAAVMFTTGPLIFIGINAVSRGLGGGLLRLDHILGEGIVTQLGAALLAYLIFDFFYYWLHRAQHAIPVLWDQHAVHHSDTAVNVTTNVRHHWTETMLYALAIYLPMAILFRLPPVTVYAIAMGFASWGFFIHSNLRIELGGWSWVAAAPQVHRIHHSRLPEHADKNFAAYFPIWDVLFGTYWHPRKGEFPPTGLHSGERIESIWLLSVWPLKLWLKRVLERLPRCTPSAEVHVEARKTDEAA